MKYLLALILLLPMFANAADLHYCRCDTGEAHGSCAAGDDGNPGTSASPKATPPVDATIEAAAAGDRFLFCRGGVWTGLARIFVSNLNATAANRITFGSYAPSWGGTAKPILTFAADEHGFEIGRLGPPDFTYNDSDDKGYVFTHMDLRGANTGTTRGFVITAIVSDILIDDVRISNFHKGGLVNTAEADVKRLTVRNSLIENNRTDGWMGAASEDTVFENNTFSGNNTTSGPGGCGAGFCHATYLGAGSGGLRTTIRNNLYINNSVGPSGLCSGGNLTMRGAMDQILIEGNVIIEETTDGGCGGISMNEGYSTQEYTRRLIIRGNTVVGSYGGLGAISTNLGAGAIIENNVVIANIQTAPYGSGIHVNSPTHNAPQGDDYADNVIVRNNTIYLLYSTSMSGIQLSVRTGHSVYNNLVYTGPTANSVCFTHSAIGNYALWDYNHCYRAGSGNWSTTYDTLDDAQAAGFDTNGTEGDPLFNNTPTSGNGWDLSVQAGSPVVSTGRNTGKPVRDMLKCQRKTPPDKGAYDRGGTPCLTITSPVGIR